MQGKRRWIEFLLQVLKEVNFLATNTFWVAEWFTYMASPRSLLSHSEARLPIASSVHERELGNDTGRTAPRRKGPRPGLRQAALGDQLWQLRGCAGGERPPEAGQSCARAENTA